jgi:hypothetical protein
MQIVESTAWALRVARLRLTSAQSHVEITLFPMLHLGTAEFFKTVYADAFTHDVVLVEGLRSPIARRITRSYRWAVGRNSMNFIVQPQYPAPDRCEAKVILADLSAEEFEVAWLEVPLWLRALINVAAPAIGVSRRWLGSRKTLANAMALNDLADGKEILDLRPETLALTHAILHARDLRLLERLGEQLDTRSEIRRLAIVYGAQHIRAVLRQLSLRGFHVGRADWLTVFSM